MVLDLRFGILQDRVLRNFHLRDPLLAVSILLVAKGVLHFGLASVRATGEVVISHGNGLWLLGIPVMDTKNPA